MNETLGKSRETQKINYKEYIYVIVVAPQTRRPTH